MDGSIDRWGVLWAGRWRARRRGMVGPTGQPPCPLLPTPAHACPLLPTTPPRCRRLLSRSWCREQLHSYTANQLVLLRPHLASLVGEQLGERPPAAPPPAAPPPPPPPPPPPVRIERRRGGEVLRVLVEARVALAEVREAAAAVVAAEAAVAAVRSAPADSDAVPVGERLSLLRLEPSPEPEHATVSQRQSLEMGTAVK